MGQLDGRIAVITGAGDGIGEGIARRFVAEGARVLVAEIDETKGERVVQALRDELGGDAAFLHTDEDHAVGVMARPRVRHRVRRRGATTHLVRRVG